MSQVERRLRRRLAAFVLRLYVANHDVTSVKATTIIEQVLRDYLPHGSTLDVVDILSDPQRGVDDGILVTPTLIKLAPSPLRRIFGDMSDRPKLLAALGLAESDRRPGPPAGAA